ncbi:DUF6262 family protein [Mycolicibacterium sp.]|uniref:DUF6262 family protein n=1 Tax=Mycolicibacterium sp. TaxID=2320850 RepID=UPI003D12E67B
MPPADNTRFVVAAARERSRRARERAERALAAAQRSPTRPAVADIAKAAKVSRSWLYTQADLMAALRALQGRTTPTSRSAQRPATTESLRQRLDAALDRNKKLREANTELTRLLEIAHGEIRRLRS